jgi:hypothetical protein
VSRTNDISLDRKFAAWLKGREYRDTRTDYIAPRTGEPDWFASGGLAPYFEQGFSGEDFHTPRPPDPPGTPREPG